MPDIILRFDDEADKEKINSIIENSKIHHELKRYVDARPTAAANAQVLAERVRTIDQIKRLYAVVMGFALTNFITNIFTCIRMTNPRDFTTVSIPLASAITFASLLLLVYLGTERMLDRKYLDIGTEKPPNKWRLLFDLFTLGAIAACFVMLGTTYKLDPVSLITIDNLSKYQDHFIKILWIFYAVNIALLFVRGLAFHKISLTDVFSEPSKNSPRSADGPTPERAAESRDAANVFAKMHWYWFLINCVSLAALLVLHFLINPKFSATSVACVLATIHILRLIADYGLTFIAYYPQASIKLD